MKRLILNMDSINGYLECKTCEDAFEIKDGIPTKCPACKTPLWGIYDSKQG